MKNTVEKTEITAEEQERKLDALLGELADKRDEVRSAKWVSLPVMLGEFESLAGHPGFWARAPKLRQQIEIARISEEASVEDSAAAGLEGAAKLARQAIFFLDSDTGKPRLAELDEVLDNFNANEITDILGRFLGLKLTQTETDDPNAPA